MIIKFENQMRSLKSLALNLLSKKIIVNGYEIKHFRGDSISINGNAYLASLNDAIEICENSKYPCRTCGEFVAHEGDVWDFDPDYHYCGREPRCCP